MVDQLFSFKDRSALSETFYRCTLKVPIGKFSAGDEIDMIVLDYDEAQIALYLGDTVSHYNLRFDLGYFN